MALRGAEGAAIGDLQRAVGECRVDRLALDGTLGHKAHELVEGDAEHPAANAAQVEVEPAAGVVERAGEQRFVVGHGPPHIAAQQPHHGAHAGRLLGLRVVRAVQARAVTKGALDRLERLVEAADRRHQ